MSIVGLGGPFALAVRAARRLAELDRRAANRLLDAHIPPLPGARAWPEARGGGRGTRSPTATSGGCSRCSPSRSRSAP